MTAFEPEKFEDKYEHYFEELDQVYRAAFQAMNSQYDSDYVHLIDQAILSESEPIYHDGSFMVEIPHQIVDNIAADQAIDEQQLRQILSAYTDELEASLDSVFGQENQPKA